MTTEQFDLSKHIYADGTRLLVEDVKEFIRELKKKIMINGNLSSRIIETEYGDFEMKHDFVLNNIVIDVIEELAGKELIEDTHESGRVKGGIKNDRQIR